MYAVHIRVYGRCIGMHASKGSEQGAPVSPCHHGAAVTWQLQAPSPCSDVLGDSKPDSKRQRVPHVTYYVAVSDSVSLNVLSLDHVLHHIVAGAPSSCLARVACAAQLDGENWLDFGHQCVGSDASTPCSVSPNDDILLLMRGTLQFHPKTEQCLIGTPGVVCRIDRCGE